jgi:hypothetical protein
MFIIIIVIIICNYNFIVFISIIIFNVNILIGFPSVPAGDGCGLILLL